MKKAKSYSGTVRVVLPGQRRTIIVANPRKKGRVDYVSPDGRTIESSRSSPAQIEVRRYDVALIQLVKLKDGRIVDPVMLVKYPRKGRFGAIHLEDQWSVELQWVFPIRPSVDGWAYLAVSDRIERYILLLKAPDDKTGWRVLDLKPEKVRKAKMLPIPDLLTLTQLDKHPDGKQLWKTHLAAEAEENQLKLRE